MKRNMRQGGEIRVPNIKSAKKRVLVSEKKNLRNRMYKSALLTSIKKYKAALAAGDKEAATELYRETVKRLDRATARGIIHKNAAARKKSIFTKALNSLQ